MAGPRPLVWLDARNREQPFPDPRQALRQPNGLLAAGGDLSAERLLNAYRHGIFPWYSPGEPILWWSPDPRAVLSVGQLHRSRSLHKAWKRQDFACTLNADWHGVLRGCSRIGSREGVWLGTAMQRAYTELHQLGRAHSLEIWRHGRLIGGLYGLSMGGIFFAESMFSRESNASKLALWALDALLQSRGLALLDGQVASPHLMRMGFTLWPREVFLGSLPSLLAAAESAEAWSIPADLGGDPAHLPQQRLPPAP